MQRTGEYFQSLNSDLHISKIERTQKLQHALFTLRGITMSGCHRLTTIGLGILRIRNMDDTHVKHLWPTWAASTWMLLHTQPGMEGWEQNFGHLNQKTLHANKCSKRMQKHVSQNSQNTTPCFVLHSKTNSSLSLSTRRRSLSKPGTCALRRAPLRPAAYCQADAQQPRSSLPLDDPKQGGSTSCEAM